MHSYETNLTWLENRKGLIGSPILSQSIEVATPPEFPKGMPDIWTPEHFFVAAVSSCLMTTFLAVAENSRLDFAQFSCHAVGKLEKVDGKFMMSEVKLSPVLVIKQEDQRERALKVLDMSEKACLISNSVKSKIIFEPVVKI